MFMQFETSVSMQSIPSLPGLRPHAACRELARYERLARGGVDTAEGHDEKRARVGGGELPGQRLHERSE